MSWMLDKNDPVRNTIVELAKSLKPEEYYNRASNFLSEITLSDGLTVNAHVMHAVDPIITDGHSVVMINRTREPGLGLPCLPGGFIDPTTDGNAETPVNAAAREAAEEVGVKLSDGNLIGSRNMDRPFDIRVAMNDSLIKYGINKNDAFLVSTQAVLFYTPKLSSIKLTAGSDAVKGSARLVPISELTSHADVGIKDHYDMITQGLQMLEQKLIVNHSAIESITNEESGSIDQDIENAQGQNDVLIQSQIDNISNSASGNSMIVANRLIAMDLFYMNQNYSQESQSCALNDSNVTNCNYSSISDAIIHLVFNPHVHASGDSN